MTVTDFQEKTKQLIDNLKGVCANYGLGNDGNEFKIITQVFLYKFINDKFAFDVKKIDKKLAKVEKWEKVIGNYSENEYEMLLMELSANTAKLKPHHFISHLFDKQNEPDFAKTFDDTLQDIAITNSDIFSVKTAGGTKVTLFDRLSDFIADASKRDGFCRALINKLTGFSFEHIFNQKFDFYATLFEYLIKDYKSNRGGKYAEYFTPHAVAKIMAAILVPEEEQGKIHNKTCYDPSAGSGTLLMNLAHAIGEDKCTIYSQDISQKSSTLLRLNLILNNLVHSIQNIIQGNTLLNPYPFEDTTNPKFDYIVSNPPFKLDFSDFRDDLDNKENNERFFAGIANVPKKAKDKMPIYQLFIQHIMYSLNKGGKAAVVVPTGFLTAPKGIDKKIRQKLVEQKKVAGVVSMPSNIFAATGTNVSILFIDDEDKGDVVLVDASKLGQPYKDGKMQKTLLSTEEENKIIAAFNNKEAIDDFSVVVTYDDIKAMNYSFSAGQYFEVKIEYEDITTDDFNAKIQHSKKRLEKMFYESSNLENKILKQLEDLDYDF